jgi:hypothetical protein
MSATYFNQECPTCGRSLQIRLEYLGKFVTCRHCQGGFCAHDSLDASPRLTDTDELLLRVDELLATVDSRRYRRQ